jgi:hypothetical protein
LDLVIVETGRLRLANVSELVSYFGARVPIPTGLVIIETILEPSPLGFMVNELVVVLWIKM